MTIYVIRLSLENLKLAKAELLSIIEAEEMCCKLLKELGEILIMEMDEEDAALLAERAAMIKDLGPLIHFDDVAKCDVVQYLEREDLAVGKVESLRGVLREYAKEVFSKLRKRNLFNPYLENVIAFVDGYVVIYRRIKPGREKRFGARSPQKRPAYLPGTMTPWLARVFINLAAVSSRKHEVVLDPFCGVGGFALEAGVQGIRVVCGDIDLKMARASVLNISGYGLEWCCDVLVHDAAQQPFRVHSFDGVSTDPPYGRMSIPQKYELRKLILKFLDEVLNVVRRNRRVVFAVPMSIDSTVSSRLRELEREGSVKVLERILQHVHSTLTRVIYVVKKL